MCSRRILPVSPRSASQCSYPNSTSGDTRNVSRLCSYPVSLYELVCFAIELTDDANSWVSWANRQPASRYASHPSGGAIWMLAGPSFVSEGSAEYVSLLPPAEIPSEPRPPSSDARGGGDRDLIGAVNYHKYTLIRRWGIMSSWLFSSTLGRHCPLFVLFVKRIYDMGTCSMSVPGKTRCPQLK